MRIAIVSLLLLAVWSPCTASESETLWNGSTGDWATVVNRSAGEPVLECPALIPAGFVSITQPGEACASLRVGSEPGVLANLQINNGGLTVAGPLTLSGGGITVSGFGANTDLGKVTMKGIFALVNGPRPILADTFLMESDGRLHVTLGAAGSLSVIEVEGAATINGLLKIIEAQTVAAGSYEVLRAGSLDGSFSSTDTPGPEWSWFVENDALFLRKSDDSPVETTSWSRIKTIGR